MFRARPCPDETKRPRTRSLAAATVVAIAALSGSLMPLGAAQAAPAPIGVTPDLGTTAGGTSVSVALGAHGIVDVESGGSNVFALSAGGKLVSWGGGALGSLGNGAAGVSTTPVDVLIPEDRVITDVAAGTNNAYAVDADGSFWAWGSNQVGELGNGGGPNVSTPEQVRLPGGRAVAEISGGFGFALALATDGTAWAWGRNTNGQLGSGTGDTATPVPVDVPAGVTFVQVSAGASNSAAVTSDGAVYTWGSNAQGQLGDGTNNDSPLPVQALLPAGVEAASVDVGTSTTAAVATDGTAYAWGANFAGQLGNGTTDDSNIPGEVQSPAGAVLDQLTFGQSSAAAVSEDGAGLTWGGNFAGQLGDGTLDSRSVPGAVRLPGARAFADISTGDNSAVALGDDGTVWTWGAGREGQLGNGSTADSLVPTQVDVPFTVDAVSIDGIDVPFSYDPAAGPNGSVTFTTPAHPAGVVDIVVSTSDGAQVAANSFAFIDAPAITSGDAPDGVTGQAYSFTVTATGTGPIAYTVTSGALPAGLTLDAATGVISGTPTTEGTSAFTVSASNVLGTDTQDQLIVIAAAPVITSGEAPDALVGEAYSFPVTAAGTGPISYAVSAGALPEGLTLDPSTGVISGTPTSEGTSTFTVTASNSVGTDSQDLSITVTELDGGTPPVDPGDGGTPVDPGQGGGVTPVNPGGGTPPSQAGNGLAFTGTDGLLLGMGIGTAALLVLAGIALVIARRREQDPLEG